MILLRSSIANSLKLLLAGGFLLLATTAHAVEITEGIVRDYVTTHVLQKVKLVVPAQDQSQIQVTILKVPSAPFQFPDVNKTSQVKITTESPLGDVYSERAIVRVRMSANGHEREIGVPVAISVNKPVWVVKNTIGAGQPLQLSDFEVQTRKVSHTYAYAIGAEQPIGLYVARINLHPDQVLDKRMIQIPPDVRYNDEVRILMTNRNGMTVTIPGIALGNAQIGGSVRVRQSLYQRKYYTAKVIDKKRVLVEM